MEHLFSARGAFDHVVTRWCLGVVAGALLFTPLAIVTFRGMGKMSPRTRADVWTRYRTWLVIAPGALVPILACAATAMGLVLVLSLLCFREFARATGLFRDRLLSGAVACAIVATVFACADNWYGLFVAVPPLTVVLIAGLGVLEDRPEGYLQRVSLACMAYLLFGAGLAHLAFLANDADFRPILCALVLCVQGGDILAYVCGKLFGRRRVFPNTSPRKTLGGHLGALLAVAPTFAFLAHLIWPNTPLDRTVLLLALGLLVGAGAQLGDLVLSSIKRDLGVKDLATSLPGHGGFTDRCNSLLLVAPAAFHMINTFVDLGAGRAARVFTSH
ncbi:MAG: phosphatidate cytidylyltransferase [Planctomycetota bacterium]|nr:phosphatidate cytidylyltransferase [Planctomycetota bacterium]